MRLRTAGAVAFITVTSLLLSGCTSGTITGTGSNASDANNCVQGPVKVGIIPKLGTDPYMVTVKSAAEAAARKEGSGEVIYTSPSDRGPGVVPV